MNCDEYSS